MFKRNITFKLTFGFLSIVIISNLFIGIIALSKFKNNIYEVKKNNMRKHALAISDAIKPYVNTKEDSEELMKIVKVLGDTSNAKVWIMKSDKSIVTEENNIDKNDYINIIGGKNLYDDIMLKIFEGLETYDESYNSYYDEEMMTVGVPIKDNNKILGGVIFYSSISDLSKSMDEFFINLILVFLGELIIVGGLGYYFSRNIVRPIKKINSYALELARGHYGINTDIYQKDEIGELANSFDLLSLKLKYTVTKLSEEKNKLGNVITSINEGLIALDKNLEIININEAAKNYLLFNEDKYKIENNAVENLGIIEVLEKLDIKSKINPTLYDEEEKSIFKNHMNKVLEFSLSSIKNDLSEVIGCVILIRDISEKAKLEQMRKDFVSNVSHEFRTPLTVIKGNLESIVDGMIKPEETKDTCITLIKETNRLERMVKDLLNLSKLESGKIELDLEELEVNTIIRDVIRSLRPLINNKALEIKLSLDENLPTLLSDYDKLKQLLIIFIDNAIKFSPSSEMLQVSTNIESNNIYITIEDHGIGIPKEEIEFLGERFYKGDKSRSSNIGGTGLGLSIAKRLVTVLNGSFYIESELNKGTKIIVIISNLK